jgi:ABC-type dipeptide/oligopeptide/nickel transport system permease component
VRGYVLERLLHGAFVLFGISVVTFLVVNLTGDPVLVMLGIEATPEQIALVRQQLGLDQPLPVQYTYYMGALLGGQGELGKSFLYKQPAIGLVVERLPATLQLALVAMGMSLCLSLPLGSISAVRRGSWTDRLGTVFIFAAQSAPSFFAGIMLILIFGVQLQWLPVSGRGGPEHLIMPALALAVHSAAYETRLLRGALLEVLSQDYIRTAAAKGLREAVIIMRHGLRNALLPLVTASGVQFAVLMSGAVIVEAVFAWPGVGSLAVQAINNRDVPLVMSSTMIFATIIVLVNLTVDLSYGALDPRIRVGR